LAASDDESVDQKGTNPAVDLAYSEGEVASYLQNTLKVILAAEVSAVFIYLSSKVI
jgi:hypothetical protein